MKTLNQFRKFFTTDGDFNMKNNDDLVFEGRRTVGAIKGIALANRKKGNHIVISAVEHPAVFEVAD